MPQCEFYQIRETDVGLDSKVGRQEEVRLCWPVFEFSLYIRVENTDGGRGLWGALKLHQKVAADAQGSVQSLNWQRENLKVWEITLERP